MKPKIFLDTNIVLDLLSERVPFYPSAKKIFELAENQLIELQISAISFVNIQYILRKQVGPLAMRTILGNLRLICTVCNVGEKEIDLAILSEMKDFEDAVQYFSAINNNSSVIITRNIKDFKGAAIPVMNATEYLSSN